jgi:hypothetical protein
MSSSVQLYETGILLVLELLAASPTVETCQSQKLAHSEYDIPQLE